MVTKLRLLAAIGALVTAVVVSLPRLGLSFTPPAHEEGLRRHYEAGDYQLAVEPTASTNPQRASDLILTTSSRPTPLGAAIT